MQAGELGAKVTIEHPIEAPDEFGNPITVWQPFATAWAAVEPVRVAEHVASGSSEAPVYSIVTTRFRIRYLAGLDPSMRIQYDGRVFEIAGILDDGRRRELTVLTRAVV